MALIDISNLDLDIDAGSMPMWSVVVGDYKYVLYSTNKALVFKGDQREPSYEITPIGCSCPGDRYSSNPCKHRKAITFLGDGSVVPPEEGTAIRAKETSNIEFDAEDLFG